LMIMASDDVEIFANAIRDNATVNALVASFLLTGNDVASSRFDPYPSRVFIHGNAFGPGGQAPDETKPLGAVLASVMSGSPGGVVPSIVYDGLADPKKGAGPNPDALCIR